MSKTKPTARKASHAPPPSTSTTHTQPTAPPSKAPPTPSGPTGITKRRPKAKPLSRAQRLRREKGVERAEQVIDRTSKKVEKSAKRLGTRRGRRREWEDVNGDAGVRVAKSLNWLEKGEGGEGMVVDEEDGIGEKQKEEAREWVDEESDGEDQADETVQKIRRAPAVLGGGTEGGGKGVGVLGEEGGQRDEEEL